MRRTNKMFLAGGIGLAILAVGAFAAFGMFGGDRLTAVYLKTGDLYFGKLQRFPSYGLKQPYLLQINRNDPQNPVNVQRFKNVFWGPEDFMSLNSDEVVWTSRLRADSDLQKLVEENPDLRPSAAQMQQMQQQAAQQQAAQQAQQAAPSDKK